MNEMKDWPAKLRFNAAVCAHAKESYVRYCEAYAQPICGWLTLDSVTRQRWMERSEMLFKVAKSADVADCYPAAVTVLDPVSGAVVLQSAARQEAAKILNMHPIDPRD